MLDAMNYKVLYNNDLSYKKLKTKENIGSHLGNTCIINLMFRLFGMILDFVIGNHLRGGPRKTSRESPAKSYFVYLVKGSCPNL